MPSKQELREIVRQRQDEIAKGINTALRGKKLAAIESVLTRVGRGSALPHWYQNLKQSGSLPNLDGKTIGSVVEMLLVGILETSIFSGLGLPPLRINPARGVKSPSKNYCTSEPFFSAYQRLLGGEYDILVLLTDYQIKKHSPPLKLQIIGWRYLTRTQVADRNLCAIGRKHRDWLIAESEATAQRVFRFLAYINQSDWRGRAILQMIDAMQGDEDIKRLIDDSRRDFNTRNRKAAKKDRPLIPDSDLQALERIGTISPCHVGVVEAADNWVIEVLKDAARSPSADEWNRLKSGPLDGQIGMSFALQWRYNFGRLFGVEACELDPELPIE